MKNILKKYGLVNSKITEENFPKPDRMWNDYKLYHFDRYISSEDAIKEMQKDGYEPANLYELIAWNDGKTDWVVALGQVYDDYVGVLRRYGSERDLDLSSLDGDWVDFYRFLAVRDSNLRPSDTSTQSLDTLSLDQAIEICKDNGLQVIKPM